MSDPSTAVHFLPWCRRGMSAALTTQTSVTGRPTFDVSLHFARNDGSGVDDVARVHLEMLGPGDVQGLDARCIVRREPQPDAQRVEPTGLAFVELAHPELPWLFSPGDAPAPRPWLCLLVVPHDERLVRVRHVPPEPNPVLEIDAVDELGADFELPDLTDAAWWGHVQITGERGAGWSLQALVESAPGCVVSRVLSPQRLQPDTRYLACVVPTWRGGVEAGLGRVPEPASVLDDAWTTGQQRLRLPVYDHWPFRTGASGDFESLVRRLEARPLPQGAGGRALALELGGDAAADTSMRLEGVFRAPNVEAAHLNEVSGDIRDVLERRVAGVHASAADAAPVFGLPLYGQWPARRFLLGEGDGWLRELNLDPRHRAAAGAGAEVVRRQQDILMRELWRQLGEFEPANALLARAQLSREVSQRLHARLATASDGALLEMTSAVHSRVLSGETPPRTVAAALSHVSGLPPGTASAAMRRAARRQVAAASLSERAVHAARDLAPEPELNGHITPPRAFSGGHPAPSTEHMIDPDDAAALCPVLEHVRSDVRARTASGSDDTLPTAGHGGGGPLVVGPTGIDAQTSQSLQAKLSHLHALYCGSMPGEESGESSSLQALAETLRAALDPQRAIESTLDARLEAPESLRPSWDRLGQMRPGVEFPQPMFVPLRELSPELVLPGVAAIPQDTVTLVETNPQFIEAYLVGLSHELARECVWRSVAVDLSTTFFRQFWDVSQRLQLPTNDAERELRKDIAPIDLWSPQSALGEHLRSGEEGELVLLIRGELLRRYPETMIYAVAAEWVDDVDPLTGEFRRVRRPRSFDSAQDELTQAKWPRFSGALPPDIAFVGFELTTQAARGALDADGLPVVDAEDAGWFFVFQERPTGVRFGLDAAPDGDFGPMPPLSSWNDLSWGHESLTGARVLHSDQAVTLSGAASDAARWGADGADMASILLSRPFRLAVHADDMLLAPEGSS